MQIPQKFVDSLKIHLRLWGCEQHECEDQESHDVLWCWSGAHPHWTDAWGTQVPSTRDWFQKCVLLLLPTLMSHVSCCRLHNLVREVAAAVQCPDHTAQTSSHPALQSWPLGSLVLHIYIDVILQPAILFFVHQIGCLKKWTMKS